MNQIVKHSSLARSTVERTERKSPQGRVCAAKMACIELEAMASYSQKCRKVQLPQKRIQGVKRGDEGEIKEYDLGATK